MSADSAPFRVLAIGSSEFQDSIRDALGGDRSAIDLVIADSSETAVETLGDAPADCALVAARDLTATIETVHDHLGAVPVVAVLAADRIDASDALAAGADDCLRADLMAAHPAVARSRIRGVVDQAGPTQAGSTRTGTSGHGSTQSLDPDGGALRTAVPEDSVTEAIFDAFPNGAVTLVGPDLTYRLAGGALFDTIEIDPEEVVGTPVSEVPAGERDVFVEAYSQALAGSETMTETTLGEMILVLRTAPVFDADGSVIAAVGMTQDVTERNRYERELERRERILQDLHVAMRELSPPASADEVWSFIVAFIEESVEAPYVSVKRFDEQAGVLRPGAKAAVGGDTVGPGVVDPGSGPLWDAFRVGDTRAIDVSAVPGLTDTPVTTLLAIPVGRFGLIVVGQCDDATDAVDRDLFELMATNATAVFQTLKQDRERSTLADRLDSQQQSIDELRTVVTAIQRIQDRIFEAESRDAVESIVCAELVEIEPIEFAWIGRPRGTDANLDPTAWAGDAAEYLDVALQDRSPSLPAIRAVDSRETQFVSRISERVHDDGWATEALSVGFRSALSVPLRYEGVLYGVLTVYFSEDHSESVYRGLIEDLASLVVTASRLLDQRHSGAEDVVELEFTLTDARYPLHRLAAETGAHIRFDTVAKVGDDSVRILATVIDGDGQAVLDRASDCPDVSAPDWFGDSDNGQVTLTLDRPSLVGILENHGGTLQSAVSTPAETQISVTLPRSTSARPLLEALTDRYTDIDFVAQHTHSPDTGHGQRLLTDRQHEILTAAYHGGYYETPRSVTGEDIAETLGISGTAVSNHLKSAHRSVVGEFLNAGPTIDFDS